MGKGEDGGSRDQLGFWDQEHNGIITFVFKKWPFLGVRIVRSAANGSFYVFI
jgi:hypothetical protein